MNSQLMNMLRIFLVSAGGILLAKYLVTAFPTPEAIKRAVLAI